MSLLLNIFNSKFCFFYCLFFLFTLDFDPNSFLFLLHLHRQFFINSLLLLLKLQFPFFFLLFSHFFDFIELKLFDAGLFPVLFDFYLFQLISFFFLLFTNFNFLFYSFSLLLKCNFTLNSTFFEFFCDYFLFYFCCFYNCLFFGQIAFFKNPLPLIQFLLSLNLSNFQLPLIFFLLERHFLLTLLKLQFFGLDFSLTFFFTLNFLQFYLFCLFFVAVHVAGGQGHLLVSSLQSFFFIFANSFFEEFLSIVQSSLDFTFSLLLFYFKRICDYMGSCPFFLNESF